MKKKMEHAVVLSSLLIEMTFFALFSNEIWAESPFLSELPENYFLFEGDLGPRYVVQEGDSLISILQRFGHKNLYGEGGSFGRLCRINGISPSDADTIRPGKVIYLPTLSEHEFQGLDESDRTFPIVKNEVMTPKKVRRSKSSWTLVYGQNAFMMKNNNDYETKMSYSRKNLDVIYAKDRPETFSPYLQLGIHQNGQIKVDSTESKVNSSDSKTGVEGHLGILYSLGQSKTFYLSLMTGMRRQYLSYEVSGTDEINFSDIYLSQTTLALSAVLIDDLTLSLKGYYFYPYKYKLARLKSGNGFGVLIKYEFDYLFLQYAYDRVLLQTDLDKSTNISQILSLGLTF